MKLIKSTIIIAFSLVVTGLSSQNVSKGSPQPFFSPNGNVAIQTDQMNALADTIAKINHRADDIEWSRIVYRVIDMREKQNNQLYFPVTPNEKYKSLFRLILEATVNGGLKAYEKKDFDIQPRWDASLSTQRLEETFLIADYDTVNMNVRKTNLIEKDPLTNMPVISSYAYTDFASKQTKFLIQEIVFFNKHYSRMYTKIIGIAPIYIYNETNVTNMFMLGLNKSGEGIWNFFQSSVLCWYLFDELRPFLAKQYVIPNGNETQRLTFDEFFAQKLYYSYLLGDGNMLDKMLLQTYNDAESIRREQKRIETELLNVEQDLWEY
ncbi:MAG: gliding motility protein GldN [Paludibacteraceae bacterium]|nr:gliding motility protein GldN [Paludibacteraceae bacterium]